MKKSKMMTQESFESELRDLINRYSKENGSNTPDFILAEYLRNCLTIYRIAVVQRDKWHKSSVLKKSLN